MGESLYSLKCKRQSDLLDTNFYLVFPAQQVPIKLPTTQVAPDLPRGDLLGQLVPVQDRGLRVLAAAPQRRMLRPHQRLHLEADPGWSSH